MRRIYIWTHTYIINNIACTVAKKKTAWFIFMLNSPNSYVSCMLPLLLIKKLDENYKYFMSKYDIHVHEWHGDVNNIKCKKIKTKCTLNDEHLAIPTFRSWLWCMMLLIMNYYLVLSCILLICYMIYVSVEQLFNIHVVRVCIYINTHTYIWLCACTCM